MQIYKNVLRERFSNGVGSVITYNPKTGERFIKSLFSALNKTNEGRSFVVDEVMQKLVSYFDKDNLDFFNLESGGKQLDLELRQIGVVYRHSSNEVPTMELNSSETVWSEEERESYVGQMKKFAMSGYSDCENGIFYTYVYGWFDKEKEDYNHIFFISNDAEPKTRSSHYKTLVQKLSLTRSTGFSHFFKYRFSIYYAPQLSAVLDFLDVLPKEVVAEKLHRLVEFNSQQFTAGFNVSSNKAKYIKRYPNISEDSQSKEYREFVKNHSSNLIYKTLMRSLGDYLMGSSATNKMMLQVISEYLYELYLDDFNISLMEEYDRVQKSDYAKSFETKRNIPAKIQSAMESTSFLQNGFGYVEFDEQFDLSKLPDLEEQWSLIYTALPKAEKKPELRFRKIEHRKAHGVYFPAFDCLTISVRNVNSMVHEFGHHLDFNFVSNQTLSMQSDFKEILKSYQKRLVDDGVYKGRQLYYFQTPTEVFARAFEYYCATILPRTSFTSSLEEYHNLSEYKWYLENFEMLKTYFDGRFPYLVGAANLIDKRHKQDLLQESESTSSEEGSSETAKEDLVELPLGSTRDFPTERVGKELELAQNLLKGVSLSDEILDESLFTESAFLLDPVSLSDGSKFGGVAYLLKDNIGAIYQTFKAKEPYFEMIEGLATQLHDDYEMEPNRSYIVIHDMLHIKLAKYKIPVECLTEGVASLRFADFKEVDFGATVEEQAEAVSQFLGGLAKESEKNSTTSSSLPSDEALRKDLITKVLKRVDSDPDIRGEGFNFTSVLDEFGEAFYFEKSSDEKLVSERASLLYAFLCYLYPDLGGSHADYLSDKVCSVLHKEGIVAHIRLSDELRLAVNTQIKATALNSDRAFAEIESKGLRLL